MGTEFINRPDGEVEVVPDLVTCVAPGCESGNVNGEKCDVCGGTSLVSDGEPGSPSYEEAQGTAQEVHFDIQVKHDGIDDWGRELYQNVKNERVYVLVDGWYYTTTDDGEPCFPLKRELSIKVVDYPLLTATSSH